jgi:hypothetical protein
VIQLQQEQGSRVERGTYLLLAGLPWAVGTALLCWPAVIVLELFAAGDPDHESPLPPPSSWWVRGAVVLLALAVGVWRARVAQPWPPTTSKRKKLGRQGLITVLMVAVVLSAFATYGEHRERQFLIAAGPTYGDRATTLEVGQAACDWLSARRWGPPADRENLLGPGPTDWPPGARSTRSTMKLYDLYRLEVDAEAPGPLSAEEQGRLSLTMAAWYELCPFQQFVHRPVGGGGGGSTDDPSDGIWD